ncbi:MAG: hypothetical protein R3B54_00775 [Bdellovibrionota bacterium]
MNKATLTGFLVFSWVGLAHGLSVSPAGLGGLNIDGEDGKGIAFHIGGKAAETLYKQLEKIDSGKGSGDKVALSRDFYCSVESLPSVTIPPETFYSCYLIVEAPVNAKVFNYSPRRK